MARSCPPKDNSKFDELCTISNRDLDISKQDCTSPSPTETLCIVDSLYLDSVPGTSQRNLLHTYDPFNHLEKENYEKTNFLNELGLIEDCDNYNDDENADGGDHVNNNDNDQEDDGSESPDNWQDCIGDLPEDDEEEVVDVEDEDDEEENDDDDDDGEGDDDDEIDNNHISNNFEDNSYDNLVNNINYITMSGRRTLTKKNVLECQERKKKRKLETYNGFHSKKNKSRHDTDDYSSTTSTSARTSTYLPTDYATDLNLLYENSLLSSPSSSSTSSSIMLLPSPPPPPPGTALLSSPTTAVGSRTSGGRLLIPTKENPPPELSSWLNQFTKWSNSERLLAISELIYRCAPTQVRHMMQIIEPQFQRDFISLLPKELALKVLSFLEPKDLLRAAQTCHSWKELANDNLLWKEKCKQAGIEEITKKQLLGLKPLKIYAVMSPWKIAYMRDHAIEMNWRVHSVNTPKMLKGHDDHVITCLQFSESKIVSGSDDNTLKVWSAVTGKCLKTLVGHTGGVWSSQMSGNIIISGSTDRTLKVWNAETGHCLHTLFGHSSTVRCMHLHGNRVVSGSRDTTLRVWDIETGEFLYLLRGHDAAVRCVQYDGKLVVSGAYDNIVRVWKPETEECLHILRGHRNRVYSLQFDGVHVVSGSLDTHIRVWDVKTGECKHILTGHQSLTSGMELRNNILVSGNADSTVKVWDIMTGQCLQTLSGKNKHHSAVTCLQFNNRFVITSSDDGTVKLWDVRTGEFIRNLVTLDSGGSGGVVWRIRADDNKLVCAVGSRNGTEETKLLVLDFDIENNLNNNNCRSITR